MICPHGHDEGMVERLATPDEVDAGAELGIAFDPCPGCRADKSAADNRCRMCGGSGEYWSDANTEQLCPACEGAGVINVRPVLTAVPDTLLGIPDFDDFESQAETGQGPPA